MSVLTSIELSALNRQALQAVAKQHGLKANAKSADLIAALTQIPLAEHNEQPTAKRLRWSTRYKDPGLTVAWGQCRAQLDIQPGHPQRGSVALVGKAFHRAERDAVYTKGLTLVCSAQMLRLGKYTTSRRISATCSSSFERLLRLLSETCCRNNGRCCQIYRSQIEIKGSGA